MPKSVQKRQKKQRSQNYKDLVDVFAFQPGEEIQEGETPEEVQTSIELLTEYDNVREVWAEKFQEAVEFRAGAQWTIEESEILEARGQAPIVVNRIHPIVETAKSLLTYNSPEFRSSAREDSDRDTAKVFSDLFAWMWDQSSGNEELKRIVDDYYVGGMGVMHIYQDPMADMGKGEFFLKSINPLDVYIDPNSKDVYAKDAAHILVKKFLTDEQAMQIYPDFMDTIMESDSADIGDEDIPSTGLAATEGQIFDAQEDTQYHTKRKYIERYTKEMHNYYNVYEPFSQNEYLFDEDEYREYQQVYYMRITKATGEEVYISDEDAKEELLQVVEQYGPIFHFVLPDPDIDDEGVMTPQSPIKVSGVEDENAIPGSTTVITPLSAEEMVGMENIMVNKIEKCCVKMTVSVGSTLLYTRILPTEDYPIVPLMNIHHRNPNIIEAPTSKI